MSKNQKLSFVVLGVLVMIYVVSVTIGIGRSNEESSSASGKKWVTGFHGLFAEFAPRVKLSKLRCSGSRVDEFFILNSNKKSCDIRLDDGLIGKHYFWATDIVLSASNPTKPDVYFLAKYSKQALEVTKPGSNCRDFNIKDIPSNYWLSIEMTPDTESNILKRCWLKADSKNVIGLTVTKKGKLSVACHGCDEDNQQTIILKLKL